MSKTKSRISSIADVGWRPKPSMSIDVHDLPAIKDWKVGKTYTLEVKARMVEINSGDEYDDELEENHRPIQARFRIKKVTEK
jgi:hypothetical protein